MLLLNKLFDSNNNSTYSYNINNFNKPPQRPLPPTKPLLLRAKRLLHNRAEVLKLLRKPLFNHNSNNINNKKDKSNNSKSSPPIKRSTSKHKLNTSNNKLKSTLITLASLVNARRVALCPLSNALVPCLLEPCRSSKRKLCSSNITCNNKTKRPLLPTKKS